MNNLLYLQLLLQSIMFLSVILMNVVKKNTLLVSLYLIQSVALTVLLGSYAVVEKSVALYVVVLVMFVVKAIIAPVIFTKIIWKTKLNLVISTYCNIPLTIGILAGICIFTQSEIFSSFPFIATTIPHMSLLFFGGIFISLFLIINRKGLIPQAIGVLSLENFIYSMSLFLGVKQLAYLELGILFDILSWTIIARILISSIFKHYHSFDVTELSNLKK